MTAREFSNNMISVKGASDHNLQQVDVEIPHHALVAMTGVSGSGKSTLAFDTLFKEGQRRYLSSLSSHARLFLAKSERPQVDHIGGLAPSISVDQKAVVRNPRSTVGTLTGIYDHLRLLFARVGKAYCPDCLCALQPQTPHAMAEDLKERFPNQSATILAPLIKGRRGRFVQLLEKAQKQGFSRAKINGRMAQLNPLPDLPEQEQHTIELVVGETGAIPQDQWAELIEKALEQGNGAAVALTPDAEHRYNVDLGCPSCGKGLIERSARLFSFNSPFGACPQCKGLGVTDCINPDLIIADENRTLAEGALIPTTPTGYIVYSQVTIEVLNLVCEAHGFNVHIPWKDLTPEQQNIIFRGSQKIKVPFGKHPLENRLKWSGITAKPREEGFYKGMVNIMEDTLKRSRNKNILRFVSSGPCSACKGARLKPQALSIKMGAFNIADLTTVSLRQLVPILKNLQNSNNTAETIITPVLKRLELLKRLGLDYLQLSRDSTTLSGGEAMRIRLATQIGSQLRGVLYVLDEPSLGLHRSDREQLMGILRDLRDLGNSVICVEHDAEAMRHSDWLVDLGPGAGRLGGKILFNGPPEDLKSANSQSKTRDFLLNQESIPTPKKRRLGCGRELIIVGARGNNLQNINVSFKFGALNLVTGVSGSGKSTLIDKILANALKEGSPSGSPFYDRIEGSEAIKKLIYIDQSPIGRTPRSNPATYTGLFDHVRGLFAELPESMERSWNKGRFSFNVKGGRCEDCQGAGVKVIGMHSLADVETTCPTCDGKRFSRETLEVKYKGKSITEILNLTITEAVELFSDNAPIHRILACMLDIGLGYLALGQPATTLSGGEAQRVKLASELGKPSPPGTLYILDEPTTGLHPSDVKVLLKALTGLLAKGHTIIAVEHHPDLIKCADNLIDLGPGSGDMGGQVVASGTPEEVARTEGSKTGKLLHALIYEEPKIPKPLPRSKINANAPIKLEGVSTHNLKGINVEIPVNQLTVVTGVSGSGKSSLAFDTLFAEGFRLYSENLSTYARRRLTQKGEAQFHKINGMSPAIAVSQKSPAPNPRSTLGSMTEIDEYLRLLMSRCGTVNGASTASAYSARMFSFNHHQGACSDCKGLGFHLSADPEKLITHPKLSLFEGAMSGHKTGRFYGDPKGQHLAVLRAVGQELDLNFNGSWEKLSARAQEIAMEGTGEKRYLATWHYQRKNRKGAHTWETQWLGFQNLVNEEFARKRNDKRGDALKDLLSQIPCTTCKGMRLKPKYLEVAYQGRNIYQLRSLSVADAQVFFKGLEHDPLTSDISKEITDRLKALQNLGLGYLTLDRQSGTLSGGEAMRVRLAAQLGGGLRGVVYVLDEPTTGLHPRDVQSLIKVLKGLRDQGNTVVVVEHHEAIIREADHILDLGPGAGENGGQIIAKGTPQEVMACGQSLTGQYLARNSQPAPISKRDLKPGLQIVNARANNLKNLTLSIPSGGVIAITGVSGSGKSSLIFDVVAASARRGGPVGCKDIMGLDHFQTVITLDRKPIGATPSSTPATYLGFSDHIRTLFSKTETAQAKKWRKGFFSFNSKGGRCETCNGMGQIKTELDFLPETWSTCEDCKGRRFNDEALSCLYRGFSIADVLSMNVSRARSLFKDDSKIDQPLILLEKAGLGYLKLGQPSNTLSGGESQRLKLVGELLMGGQCQKSRLYLFDEPTRGLHFHDLSHLIAIMNDLADQGHTLIVVEHSEAIISRADYVVDLGPEGGDAGGSLVYQGHPAEMSACRQSLTGHYIKEI